jgi:hypothetical protein
VQGEKYGPVQYTGPSSLNVIIYENWHRSGTGVFSVKSIFIVSFKYLQNLILNVGLLMFELNAANIFIPLDHLLLDRSPNLGPLISRWELTNSKIPETKVLEPPKS